MDQATQRAYQRVLVAARRGQTEENVGESRGDVVQRVKIDVHSGKMPTACGLWDVDVIWSPSVESVTCEKCLDLIDMRPA